jgi:hypothetical protein
MWAEDENLPQDRTTRPKLRHIANKKAQSHLFMALGYV